MAYYESKRLLMDERCHMFTLRRQRGIAPCLLKAGKAEYLDVQSVRECGLYCIASVIKATIQIKADDIINQHWIGQRTIRGKTHDMFWVEDARSLIEPIQNVVETSTVTTNAMLFAELFYQIV